MNKKYYLFSIDVEDPRDYVPNGYKYKEAVVENILQYLDWLDLKKSKATCFVVGRTADAFPDLVKEIKNRGNEIAAHSYYHAPLTNLSKEEFKADLEKNLEALNRCGCNDIIGYRAPTFSLVESAQWVYKILASCGVKYSSSVLPAAHPLYGWKNFGKERYIDGVYEIPLYTGGFPITIPFGGGVYFRCLPMPIIKLCIKRSIARNEPIMGYFHSYDVDAKQEENFLIANVPNKFMNSVMMINRSKVFKRLNKIMDLGIEIIRYDEYLKKQTAG